MGTAVLAGKPRVSAIGGVWSDEIGSPKQENAIERIARKLRLDGHDAVAVSDRGDSKKILKYFEPRQK
jgi:hypothetical protein